MTRRELVTIALYVALAIQAVALYIWLNPGPSLQPDVVLYDHATHQCYYLRIEQNELIGKQVTCPGNGPKLPYTEQHASAPLAVDPATRGE